MTGARKSVFGDLGRHAAESGPVSRLAMTFGDGIALLPRVTASGRDRWWSHITESADDLSRLTSDVFGQSLDLLGRDLGAGWCSTMTDRGGPLVDSFTELVEHS